MAPYGSLILFVTLSMFIGIVCKLFDLRVKESNHTGCMYCSISMGKVSLHILKAAMILPK